MTVTTEEILHSNILYRHDMESLVDHYDDLLRDAEDEDYDALDRAAFAELASEYDEDRIQELRDMLAYSEDESFISERYWAEYAREYADEIFNLDGTGVSVYFDYDAFEDDLRGDYSEHMYDGITYLVRD